MCDTQTRVLRQEMAGNYLVQTVDWEACMVDSAATPGVASYQTPGGKRILRPAGAPAGCMHADVVILDLRDAVVQVSGMV